VNGPGRPNRRKVRGGRLLVEQQLRQLSSEVRGTRLMLLTLMEQLNRQGQPLVLTPAAPSAAEAPPLVVPAPPVMPAVTPLPHPPSLTTQPTSDLSKRRAAAYARLVERVHAAVVRVVPAGEQVLIVSRGDEALLDLPGRRGWHFPRTEEGLWAGYHPADSAAAISHLEQLRSAGARHLVVPATSAWWLSHYAGFRAHLERTGRLLLRDEVGVVYALDPVPAPGPAQQREDGGPATTAAPPRPRTKRPDPAVTREPARTPRISPAHRQREDKK